MAIHHPQALRSDSVSWVDLPDGQSVQLRGELPHPRFLELRWTSKGVEALEWTGAGLVPGLAEGMRVVVLSTARPGASIAIQPLMGFDPDLDSFWTSPDGLWMARLSSPLDGRADTINVRGGAVTSTVEVPNRAADLAMTAAHDAVIYRDLSTAGFVRQGLSEAVTHSIIGGEFAFGDLSTLGVLAAGTASGPGVENKVCAGVTQ